MNIKTKYDIGDTVYVITDINQYKRIITELRVLSVTIMYYVVLNDTGAIFYDFELSIDRDQIIGL